MRLHCAQFVRWRHRYVDIIELKLRTSVQHNRTVYVSGNRYRLQSWICWEDQGFQLPSENGWSPWKWSGVSVQRPCNPATPCEIFRCLRALFLRGRWSHKLGVMGFMMLVDMGYYRKLTFSAMSRSPSIDSWVDLSNSRFGCKSLSTQRTCNILRPSLPFFRTLCCWVVCV